MQSSNWNPFIMEKANSYESASAVEEDMRAHMYQAGYEQHEMNTNPYYGLIKIDEKLWIDLQVNRPQDSNLLFQDKPLVKQDWYQVQGSLKQLNFLCSTGVFIAGGRIFSALFGSPYADTDLFLYGYSEAQALSQIEKITQVLKKQVFALDQRKENRRMPQRCIRTANAITISCYGNEFQVILRLYRSPSEIIHGFDVDCCSIGYDGKDIWITQRALFAITSGYNTVNFNRLSPSYGHRLAKYGAKGMAVKVPDFTRDKVNLSKMAEYFEEYKKTRNASWSVHVAYMPVKELQGLDVLLYTEYHLQQLKYNPRVINSIKKLADESSDYSPLPYIKYNDEGNAIKSLIRHMVDTRFDYAGHAEKYMPYIESFLNLEQAEEDDEDDYNDKLVEQLDQLSLSEDDKINCALNMKTGAITSGTKFFFLQCSIEDIPVMLNFPETIYKCLEVVRPWDFPAQVQFKLTNPGQQMSGTFTKLVLEDNKVWYQGKFYSM